nr:uncharacterized protein LOC113824319 isoform X2 [Penaeus vannamei]
MAFPSSDFRNLNAFFSRPSAKSLRYDMFSRGRTACPFMPKRAPLPVAPSSPRPTCQCPVSGDKQCRVVRPCKPGTSGARQLVVTGGTFQLGRTRHYEGRPTTSNYLSGSSVRYDTTCSDRERRTDAKEGSWKVNTDVPHEFNRF